MLIRHVELARRVGDALEEAGLEVWDAERDVLPGDNLALEAGQALQDSDAMVVLLTPAGVRSRLSGQSWNTPLVRKPSRTGSSPSSWARRKNSRTRSCPGS